MRDLRQRVVLVHELGQLRGTEVFLHGSSDRLGVDQILRHQAFGLCQRQALFHGPLDTDQAQTELVFCHFTNGTNTTVTEVIDIIDRVLTVSMLIRHFTVFNDVFVGQSTFTDFFFTAQTAVELHATHCGQVVTLGTKNRLLNRFSAASLVGGSPGRIMR